jgi:hypothetical protein
MREYQFRSEEGLKELTELLHDERVFLDGIDRRSDDSVEVMVSVGGVSRAELWSCLGVRRIEEPVMAAKLIIGDVESFEISDEAEVGYGNVNEVRVRAGWLEMTCDLPVSLRFKVRSISLVLQISDQVVSRHRYFTFGRSP